jgi:hypothetical protein
MPGTADDQPRPDAEDQSQREARAEHTQRVERRQRLAEDIRGVLRASEGCCN